MARMDYLPAPSQTKVFAYVRVSSKEQDQKGSLARAESAMKDWLKDNGYTNYKIFVEQESGDEADRTEWAKLREEAMQFAERNNSKTALIVVRETSRWARELFDAIGLLRPLRLAGIPLHSIANNLMTSIKGEPRPNDDLLFAIYAGLAAQVREEGILRTLGGIKESKKKGITGGSIPLLTATVSMDSNGPPSGTGYRQMWATARKDYNKDSVVNLPVKRTGETFPHPITGKARESNTIRNLLDKMKAYDDAGVLEEWFETMDVLTDLEQFIGPAVPAGKIRGSSKSYRPRKTPSRLQNIMRGYSAYLQDPINYEDFKPTKEELLVEAGISIEDFDA